MHLVHLRSGYITTKVMAIETIYTFKLCMNYWSCLTFSTP